MLVFLVGVESIKRIFQDLVASEKPILKYLLAYKFSQDHLELFFAAVRSCGGFNNNPTVQQFTSSYKRLLMRSSIKGGKGNCQQDSTSLLYLFDNTCKISNKEIPISDSALIRKYDLQEKQPLQVDHDYVDAPNIPILSEYKKAVISYIGIVLSCSFVISYHIQKG